MKNLSIFFAIILILVISAAVYSSATNRQASPTVVETDYTSKVEVIAPAETIDQETGEVDQTAFEENQQVSDDTSLTTIESELNSTVILEEDFSDL